MRKHLKYLGYVLRHKWYVFLACRILKVGLWQSLIHDWHKFLPSEWFPYVNYFYGKNPKWSEIGTGQRWAGFPYSLTEDYWKDRFDHAWNLHQKRGKHHWQFWLLTNDSDSPKHKPLTMPKKYCREMVADWWGAGKAITGNWDAANWYEKNKDQILIDEPTRAEVVYWLNEFLLKMQPDLPLIRHASTT